MRHAFVLAAGGLLLCSVAAADDEAPACLGVAYKGIFPDLDAKLHLDLPQSIAAEGVVDEKHAMLVIYDGARAVKVYPLGGSEQLALGDKKELQVALRGADAREVERALAGRPVRRLDGTTPGGDRDRDGIPDVLDVIIGAKKVALNGAAYGGDYISIKYPGGDVPRDQGVCTDVVVRALRNAGIDLQKELHEDIAAAPKAYPMVKHADSNIDQRRVKTILPWFQRHWAAHGTDPRTAADPFRAGDVLFMDTYPGRDGPEHVGIVSDRLGPSGFPLVVNNWTTGFQESEMDLLAFVPVLYRFRVH